MKRTGYSIALAAFYAGAAWGMAYYMVQLPIFPATGLIERYLTGVVPLPHQYRIFGPWLIGGIAKLPGLDLGAAEVLFYFLAFLGIFVATRAWLQIFLPDAAADLAPVWVTATMVNSLVLRFPWDPLCVLFGTLLLIAIHRRRWPIFLVLIAVGTLNRETTYLAVLAVPLVEGLVRRNARAAAVWTVAAAAVWIAVKAALWAAFPDSPGVPVQWHVGENVGILLGRTAYIDYSHNPLLAPLGFAFPFSLLQMLGALNFTWLLIFPRWRDKPDFLRRLAWLLALIVVTAFLFGNVAERRIFVDAVPIVLPLALLTFFPPRQNGSD